MHHHRYSQAANQFEKRLRLIVVRVGVLMARVDEHSVQAVFDDRPFQLLHKWRATARQGAGKNNDAIFILLLDLGGILVPAAQERKRFVVGLVLEIVDRVTDDAALDAGFFVRF